jgi:Enoyl-(Acyl carrier protein) reductase
MATRGYGRIVNVSSVAGLMGPIDLASYGAAKAGIIGLTRAAALDLADYGITVNAIAPGPIETELMLGVWNAEALQERAQHAPIARFGTVEEIAHAALFLVSPESGFINGVTLTVDGGAAAAGSTWSRSIDVEKRPQTPWDRHLRIPRGANHNSTALFSWAVTGSNRRPLRCKARSNANALPGQIHISAVQPPDFDSVQLSGSDVVTKSQVMPTIRGTYPVNDRIGGLRMGKTASPLPPLREPRDQT